MFDALTKKLGDIFERLTKRGALGEADVDEALREIRVALLEADVALAVAKDLIEAVRTRAVGHEVVRSVTPGQMVVKIVYDELVRILGPEGSPLAVGGNPPSPILMVGLQGSGKTTTTAKLGFRLASRERKKVLMASLDVYRPAAQTQLLQLGRQAGIETLAPVLGERPVAIARRAIDKARREGFDVVLLDSAGRLHIDAEMMAEAAHLRDEAKPVETLLVADALLGQDAVTMAKEFRAKLGLTGIVLTRVDGDARGGAALSMRAAAGCPIKLIGTGEKLDDLDAFDPRRVAGQILGHGDVVGLVERASQVGAHADAEELAAKMMKGTFTLDDLAAQLRQLRRMGDIKGLLGMIPGLGRMQGRIDAAGIDDRRLKRQEAIVLSMTKAERRSPDVLNASRRRRIAAGSGTTVEEINRLVKQFRQMSDMMKKAGKLGKRGFPGGMLPPGLKPPPLPGR